MPNAIAARDGLRLIYETLGFGTPFAFVRFLGAVVFLVVTASIAIRALTIHLQTRYRRGVAMTPGIDLLRRYLSHPYAWFLQRRSADLGMSILEQAHDVVLGAVAPGMPRAISSKANSLCDSEIAAKQRDRGVAMNRRSSKPL